MPSTEEPQTVREKLRLFSQLALPYFRDAEGKANAFLMLCLVLINNGFVVFSFVGVTLFGTLGQRRSSLPGQDGQLRCHPRRGDALTVLYKFQRQRLALNWRHG